MNPALAIERDLSRLEAGERLTSVELEDFSSLLDATIFRLREVWTDQSLWVAGVAENPLSYEEIKCYLQRLCEIVNASNQPEDVAKLLRPIRRFADKDFKEFLIANLRKWIERDDFVVYQLILGLDSIGERPWPLGRLTIDSSTPEGRALYLTDAREYLKSQEPRREE